MEKNIKGCPCINFCEISSQACTLKDLEDYCQPSFQLIKDAFCSMCGEKPVDCYKINDFVRACMECLKSFNFLRMAKTGGMKDGLANKVIKRL